MSAHVVVRFFSIAEVATQLSVSIKTVRRWIERKELHAHRMGRQLRVSDEDLSAFIRQSRG